MLGYVKHFDVWFRIKPRLDDLSSYPKFQEGDVWWCHIGENVGHEECGKGNKFLRPVIILKKFNNRIFFGIPTSSKLKNSPFYRPVVIKGIRVSALMSQMRLFDVKRLLYKQGKISPNELAFLKKDFIKLLIKNNPAISSGSSLTGICILIIPSFVIVKWIFIFPIHLDGFCTRQ